MTLNHTALAVRLSPPSQTKADCNREINVAIDEQIRELQTEIKNRDHEVRELRRRIVNLRRARR